MLYEVVGATGLDASSATLIINKHRKLDSRYRYYFAFFAIFLKEGKFFIPADSATNIGFIRGFLNRLQTKIITGSNKMTKTKGHFSDMIQVLLWLC